MVKIKKSKHKKYANLIKICPECKGYNFLYDSRRKEVYCIQCGLVLQGVPEAGIIYPSFSYYNPATKKIVLDPVEEEQQCLKHNVRPPKIYSNTYKYHDIYIRLVL